ncbi:MAG: hypothetical protein NE328_03015 [Lentisphaeraceae bacterium]|nr:hypothetical protein [Lentisphaeraceae bacterium]
MNKLDKYEGLIPAIRQVILTSLESGNGERFNFDDAVICDEIVKFIFKDEPTISDHDRYEWLALLQAKAHMIAQAWKINYAASVKFRDESHSSIISYLRATYGVQYKSQAA